MNLLIITTLYPNKTKQTIVDTSYAVHQYAQKWLSMGVEIKVIRVSKKYPKIFNFFDKGKDAFSYEDNETFYLDGVEVLRNCVRKYPKIAYLKKDKIKAAGKIITRLENEYKPDAVLCHLTNASLEIGVQVKKYFDVPLILTLHSTDVVNFKDRGYRLKEYKRLKNEVDLLGFRSDKVKNMYVETLGSQDPLLKRSFIAPSGVDQNEVVSVKDVEMKAQRTPGTIFIASKLVPLKNIDVLIAAFNQIPEEYNLRLLIAGDGPERGRLEKIARDSIGKERIEFLGLLPREQVLRTMKDSEIFAMISAPETYGLVYLEAMAKGCITIGSRGEGIDGVIKDGENGFLVEPKNVKELTEKLMQSLQLSFEEREALTKNGRETATELSSDATAGNYLDQIEAAVERYKRGSRKNEE